ncbi:hypothetical protein JXA80_08115 [bacterium]|nr:hypothetical protein [candidate division CSSED10-310 bacterium]
MTLYNPIHLVSRTTLCAVLSIIVLAGCASTPITIPNDLMAFDIESACENEARVVGLELKATTYESDNESWIAVYWKPSYFTTREPDLDLLIGNATYIGKEGDTYYYRCGSLPRSNYLGAIILPKPTDRVGPRNPVIKMYRRSDSRCLELDEVTSIPGAFSPRR